MDFYFSAFVRGKKPASVLTSELRLNIDYSSVAIGFYTPAFDCNSDSDTDSEGIWQPADFNGNCTKFSKAEGYWSGAESRTRQNTGTLPDVFLFQRLASLAHFFSCRISW